MQNTLCFEGDSELNRFPQLPKGPGIQKKQSFGARTQDSRWPKIGNPKDQKVCLFLFDAKGHLLVFDVGVSLLEYIGCPSKRGMYSVHTPFDWTTKSKKIKAILGGAQNKGQHTNIAILGPPAERLEQGYQLFL